MKNEIIRKLADLKVEKARAEHAAATHDRNEHAMEALRAREQATRANMEIAILERRLLDIPDSSPVAQPAAPVAETPAPAAPVA